MLVTELGILMEVKELQPSKVLHPMLVMELGILIEVKELQDAYLYITTSQHLTYKKVEKRSGIFDN